ncbi:MAG: TadE/TadG family type IV pilus assembly protein [Candidatus Limnocylindria bacterium]
MVETAVLLPILLILLLGAIDFGRAFFGYVNLHQAVRVAANFAAMNPNMTPTERDRYVELVEADAIPINCELEAPVPNPSYTTSAGAPTAVPTLGDYATVTLGCDFSPVTPLIELLLGDPVSMSATSTFPVRQGCINCPTPPPATPPPPPVQCFLVPDMVGMSVAGARLAWASAGFSPDNFTLASGDETSTVSGAPPDEGEAISNCDFPTYALFSSSVVVTTLAAEECDAGFAVVPNTIGASVADARTAWGGEGFNPLLFEADGADPDSIDNARIVVSQTTEPPSDPGVSCLELATTAINVVTGEPWPAPPPTPCEVPSMINHPRAVGESLWVNAGFSVANFSPRNGGFTIRSQSLVGGNGAYVTCEASITVSANP